MKTCLHLREYEGILDPEDIYGLLALASCANRAFATCSRAFIRLEALTEVSFTNFTSWKIDSLQHVSKVQKISPNNTVI